MVIVQLRQERFRYCRRKSAHSRRNRLALLPADFPGTWHMHSCSKRLLDARYQFCDFVSRFCFQYLLKLAIAASINNRFHGAVVRLLTNAGRPTFRRKLNRLRMTCVMRTRMWGNREKPWVRRGNWEKTQINLERERNGYHFRLCASSQINNRTEQKPIQVKFVT